MSALSSTIARHKGPLSYVADRFLLVVAAATTIQSVVIGVRDQFQDFRIFYASSLLDAGESIKALSEYLGHANPGFTLRYYTHLMPTSEGRTRKAIDDLFRPKEDPDGLETA